MMETLEKYNCEKCRFSTKDPNKYKNHVSLHNDIKYACSHCNFVSYTKTEFQRHLVTHTGKFPYTCEYCGYGAIRNDYIVKHIKRIHGDGKIQCSVSTLESESKNTSVNIVQTQVTSSIQEIVQNKPFVDIIDLTRDVDNCILTSNGFQSNGSNVDAGQVEVEIVSPVDQPLYPWMPLTVVAPTTFNVPANCIAEVVEVKPVNSTCHLVLKCLAVVDSFMPNHVFKKENISDQTPLEAIVPPVSSLENPGTSPLQESTVLPDDCNENRLPTKNTATVTEENNNINVTCPPANDNGLINAIEELSNGISDDIDEVSDGPIISSVFSLSSGSQNIIEGIQWECPAATQETSPSKDTVDTTHSSVCTAESQYEPTDLGTESNCQMETEKSDEQLQTTVLQSESESPEKKTEEFKPSTYSEIQSPPMKPALTCDRKPESQTSAFLQRNKGGQKLNRLSKVDTSLFSKPQTLFLSCDKRIVMQPLSCVMQNGNNTDSRVLAVSKLTEQEQVPVKKVKKQSAKAKVKTLPKKRVAPTLKGRSLQSLKTLRLIPVKVDQFTQMPYSNQPVVVLNHPDLESLETSYIMKAISMFKGKVVKVTLSKEMCKKYV